MDKLNVRYSNYFNREYIVTIRRHFNIYNSSMWLQLFVAIKVKCYRLIKGSLIWID